MFIALAATKIQSSVRSDLYFAPSELGFKAMSEGYNISWLTAAFPGHSSNQ
jgi:hypothetical protein